MKRIQLYRMTCGTIRSARSEVVAPLGQHRVVIEARHAIPCDSIIFTLEEPDRARSSKPDSGLSHMTRGEKEHMVERESVAAGIVRSERGGCSVLFGSVLRWI